MVLSNVGGITSSCIRGTSYECGQSNTDNDDDGINVKFDCDDNIVNFLSILENENCDIL